MYIYSTILSTIDGNRCDGNMVIDMMVIDIIDIMVIDLIYPLVISHSYGSHGPNRNRWFTVLKNGGSFHGEL